jgi:integrase
MATIRRRGTTWQVQVRRQGHATLSRTFRLKADAEQWARQKEAEIDRGELPVGTRLLRAHTLGTLLERYAATIIPRKRSAERELYMVRGVLRHPLSLLSLARLTPSEVAKYRDERLALVSGATVRRELAIVRHCLQVARNEWGFALPTNAVDHVKLPSPSNPRARRAAESELERLLAICKARGNSWLASVIELAIETGMRRSELLAMCWADVDFEGRTVHLRRTKNGPPQNGATLTSSAGDHLQQSSDRRHGLHSVGKRAQASLGALEAAGWHSGPTVSRSSTRGCKPVLRKGP